MGDSMSAYTDAAPFGSNRNAVTGATPPMKSMTAWWPRSIFALMSASNPELATIVGSDVDEFSDEYGWGALHPRGFEGHVAATEDTDAASSAEKTASECAPRPGILT